MKKSKRLLSLTLAFMLILSAFIAAPNAVYANEIRVTINGEQVTFPDANPANVDGRTLVPVRAVFEALDFTVGWDMPTQTATLTRGNDVITISIGSTTFTTNGVNHNLDVPAAIIGGSTMVPIRLPLESVGYYVDWNGATQTVIISSTPINVTQSTSSLPDGRFTEVETIQWMLNYREAGATTFELRVVELINEIRAEHGLGQVVICETLMMANRLMSQLSYYYHFSLNDNAQLTFFDDPFNNIDRAFGFGVGRSAIVIGLTADMLVNEMMANWQYANAILNPDNRFIGVGRYGSLTGAFTFSMRSQNAEFPFRTLYPNAPMVAIGGEQFSTERRAISLHYRLFSGDSLTNNDIVSLQYMPHLVSLRLGRSSFATTDNITDLSPLVGLTGLTHLTISNVAVENISPLAELTNLTELILPNNRITDVSPLRNLTNLTYLDLTNNSITNTSPLAGLVKRHSSTKYCKQER